MVFSCLLSLCKYEEKKNKLDEVTATYEKGWGEKKRGRCVKAFLGDAESACWEKTKKDT